MVDFAKAVAEGIDKRFIDDAESYWAGDRNKPRREAVTTTQIRNVFGSVKRMQMTGELNLPEFLLLRARLRYAVSRVSEKKKRYFDDFAKRLEDAINAVEAGETPQERKARFRRFCQGFEAILAYHRAHGGK